MHENRAEPAAEVPPGSGRSRFAFGVGDLFLLMTAVACVFCYAAVIFAGTPVERGILAACVLGASAVATGVAWPVWRYLFRKRFTVLVVAHALYVAVACGLFLIQPSPELLGDRLLGPLAGIQFGAHPGLWLGGMALPFGALMLAHPFRPSGMAACVTCIGTTLWYFSGALMSLYRMP